MISTAIILLFALTVCHAGPTLLGIGRGSGSGINLAGASFELNPAHPAYGGISAVTGKTLHLDLEKLDISVSHGLMSLSRNGVNFTRGMGKWRTEYFDERMEITRNNLSILQIIASDRLDLYNFKYNGIGFFSDVILDKTLLQPTIVAYCKAERKALGRGKRDVESCNSDTAKMHLSSAQLFDQVAKVLGAITDASHTSTEEVHNRLKGSYEDAVKAVVNEFNSELSTVKEARSTFLEWQEKQREALNSMSNVEEVVHAFKKQLTSNLLFVEERQEEIFAKISELTLSTASNFSEVEVHLSEVVNNTIPLLVEATKNSTVEIVDSKLDPVIADIVRIEIILNGSLKSLSALNEHQHAMQRETNSSLGLIHSSLDTLNATVVENYADAVAAIATINQSMIALGRAVEEDVEATLANLTSQINSTNSDLLSLATLHNKSHTLVSESISNLNSQVHYSLAELRNFTLESLDWVVSMASSNYSELVHGLDAVNASLQARADSLLNTTQALYALVNASSGKSQEQLNEAVNNISISIAHSNSIFAKVIKELNGTLTVLNDNHVSLHTVILPNKIEELANKSNDDLQSAVSNLTTFFMDGLELMQMEAAHNLTSLYNNVTTDVRDGLSAVNSALLKIMEVQKQDKAELQRSLVEQESNFNVSVAALDEKLAVDLAALNQTAFELANAAAIRDGELNSTLMRAISHTAEVAHNTSLTLQQLLMNRTELAYQQIASLDGAVLKLHRNFTKDLSDLQHASYENITILHDLFLHELGVEVTGFRSSLNDTNDAVMKLNSSLSATLEATAGKFQREIAHLGQVVNSSRQSLLSDLQTSEKNFLQLLTDGQDRASSQLAGNISSVRSDVAQSFSVAEASLQALTGQTSANLSALHSQMSESIAAVNDSLQSALSSSNQERKQQVLALQDRLHTQQEATAKNFTLMFEHMVFESDYAMTMINDSRKESAAAVQTVSDRLSSLNVSLANRDGQLQASIDGTREILLSNVTHVLAVIGSVNDSLSRYGEKVTLELTNITSMHEREIGKLQSKVTELNMSQELHFRALLDALDEESFRLDSRVNETEQSLRNASNNLSVRIDEVRKSAENNLALLNTSLATRIDQVVDTDSKLQVKVYALESKADAHHAFVEVSLSNLMRAMNESNAMNLASQLEIRELHRKSVNDTNEEFSHVKGNFSRVETSIVQLREREASERQALQKNITETLSAFQLETSNTLYSAEVKTNMSLLQQQILIGRNAEHLSNLDAGLEELKQAHSTVTATVANQSNSILAVLQGLHTQHTDHALAVQAQMSNLTDGVIPGLASSMSVMDVKLGEVRKKQDGIDALHSQLLADQLQQAANLTYLAARLSDEANARKEQDSSMHAFFFHELNRTTSSTSQAVSALQVTVNAHAERIATVVGQTNVLTNSSNKFSEDIDSLKGKAVKCEATALEVERLTKQVDSLQTHIQEQQSTHQKEIQELRASFAQALDLIKNLQGSVDKHGDKLDKVVAETVSLRASAASKEQVDLLKDKVAEVQQGVVMQATSALQLVQTFYQQQQSTK